MLTNTSMSSELSILTDVAAQIKKNWSSKVGSVNEHEVMTFRV